jgi:hypothetical protein
MGFNRRKKDFEGRQGLRVGRCIGFNKASQSIGEASGKHKLGHADRKKKNDENHYQQKVQQAMDPNRRQASTIIASSFSQ